MKTMNRFIVVSLILFIFPSWAGAEADSQQAYELIDKKINSLMQAIESSKVKAQFSDAQKIMLVDEHLGDVVDFKRIARRVMAKHFKGATKAQQSRFLTVFKDSLLNTYAMGLWEFNNYKVNLLPLNKSNQTLRNTQVGFEVVTSSGQVFPVVQSLYFHPKKNQWFVQNVIINGINMGLLFRDQFARLVAEKGSIDLAIDHWSVSEANSNSAASMSPQGAP